MKYGNREKEIDQKLIDEFDTLKSSNLFNNNIIRLIMVVAVVIMIFITGASIGTKNDNSGLTTGQVDDILVGVNDAFDRAENDILDNLPNPDPDPEPLGPDPDPDKCVCGGTGIITHGDGHTTDCPYHKQEEETNKCKEGCKKNCKKSCNCGANENKGFIQQASSEKVEDKKETVKAPDEKQEAVKKNYRYKLYVFSAEFCGPCKQLDKYVWQNLVDSQKYSQDAHQEIKNFLEEKNVKFQKYIWENAEDKKLFTKNSINRFPTIILTKDGKVIVRTIGYLNKSSFKSLINSKISKGG